MLRYIPEKFSVLAASPEGKALWKRLTTEVMITRLETASEMGKPAVEGIEGPLLSEFGEKVLVDRVKQMIGHMVKQIMEDRGWVLDQSDVKVQSIPFNKASRYRRQDSHMFYAFRNSDASQDVAISDRRQNPGLPKGVKWVYYASFDTPLKAAIGFDIRDMQRLRTEVRSKGYARIEVRRMMRPA